MKKILSILLLLISVASLGQHHMMYVLANQGSGYNLTQGLIAVYEMNESGGRSINASYGLPNHLWQNSGALNVLSGIIDNKLGLISNQSYVTSTASNYVPSNIRSNNNFTVAFWADRGSTNGYINCNAGGTTASEIRLTSSSSITLGFSYNSETEYALWTASTTGYSGMCFFVITNSATSDYKGNAQVYINGTPITTTLTSTATVGTNPVSANSLTLYSSSNSAYAFDQTAFWNRVLNIDEISYLYNNGNGIRYQNYNSISTPSFFQMSGGTETTSGDYKIHTFTTNGTLTINSIGDYPAEILVVGGGGGAGKGTTSTTANGGGGGAGGLYYNSIFTPTTGDLSITVGGGGAGATSTSAKGSNGSASSVIGGDVNISVNGGGGGGSSSSRTGESVTYASGGGAGLSGTLVGNGGTGTGDVETYKYGTTGKSSVASTSAGGGGGARAGSGSATGGLGFTFWETTYAAGGNAHSNAAAGAANTGSGGNAAATNSSANGGNGGSGVVIVRYKYQ